MNAAPVRRLATALAAAALAVSLTATPAAAHTSLVAATPASDSTVRPPADIELTYGEPVRFVGVVVLDARGHHHEAGRPQVVDAKVTQRIAGTLPNGVYTVGWRVVALDGHPVTGQYRFTVVPGGSSPAGVAPASRPAARQPSRASWWWVGLGALVLAGAAGGAARIRQRPRREMSDKHPE